MKKAIKMLFIVGGLSSVVYLGYWIVDGFSLSSDELAKMNFSTETRKKLPIGILSDTAKEILQKEDYKCIHEIRNKEYLYCHKLRWVLIGSYLWLIRLEIEDDKIKNIKTDISSSSL